MTFSSSKMVLNILRTMKELRVGNCYEQSVATCLALKLNNIKNVSLYSLHALDKKTGEVIDLDHVVVGVNIIKTPIKNLSKFKNQSEISKLIKPNNKSIIVDTWSGIADDANTALNRYRSDIPLGHEISDNCLILLKPDEKIELSPETKDKLLLNYSSLLLDNSKPMFEIPQSTSDGDSFLLKEARDIKRYYNLKSTRPLQKLTKTNDSLLKKIHKYLFGD